MSYAGLGHLAGAECGDMPDVGQEMGIEPRARASSTGLRIVPTVWAQRALNAAGVRTAVDGIAGPATLRSLVSAWTSMGRSGAQPVLVDAGHVAISPGFEGRLSLLRRVADPSGSTCGPCQWTSCPSSTTTRRTTTTPSTAPGTPAGPPGTPAGPSEPLAPPPGSEPGLPIVGGGGLIARYGIWPWVIGGTALVGLGVWFLMGGGAGASVRANRRRRVRRNNGGYELVYQTGGHGGPYWSLDAAERRAEALMAGGRDQWIAVVPREEIVDLNEAHSVATLRRGLGWLRGRTRLPISRVVRNKITPRQRARLPKSAFVFPSRRAWPINNARRAYAAIQFLRMGRVGSVSDFNEIRNEVRRRYPDVWAIYGKNLTWERSKAAKAKRRSTKAARRTTRGTRRRIAANRRAR